MRVDKRGAMRVDAARAVFNRLQLLGALAQAARQATGASAARHADRPAAAAGRGHAFVPGDVWGRFTVLEAIGAGSFAEVYRVVDPRVGVELALKVPIGAPRRSAAELLREADALGRVRHPNVVATYGLERWGGQMALVMELVRGTPLDRLLAKRERLTAGEVAGIGMGVCRAISAVHGRRLLHRDIKAQNIVVEEGGRIVLVDFGLSRLAWRAPAMTGRLSGTPLYMAPEVLDGARPTRASDLYSLGVLLYHLATKDFPVRADSVDAVAAAHRARRTRPMGDVCRALPAALAEVVAPALSYDPALRPANAGLVHAALQRVAGAHSVP
jgi:serine/threonine protein kinase